jgi:DNA-binding IclR family transcriptional regulator
MNNTLKNGIKILEYLAETAKSHSVKELAEIFRLPNSHICRLLKTLTDTGYVEQEKGNRKYKISLGILSLSNACLRRMEIRKRTRPYAQRLAIEMGQPVFIGAPHKRDALIVDVLYPDGAINDSGIAIGSVNQSHVSATGKVCAAYKKDIDSYIDSLDLYKITDKTITDPEIFKNELHRIREEKVAVTNSEIGEDVCAVASPLFNCEGEFVAAIGVTLPHGQKTQTEWDLFKNKIRETAESVSFALGYSLYNLV